MPPYSATLLIISADVEWISGNVLLSRHDVCGTTSVVGLVRRTAARNNFLRSFERVAVQGRME